VSVHGIHHITAIAGPAQENLDFYSGVLGMRLVKRSVNQDDPGTYHLFYADNEGRPGTDLTFFPWARLAPGRKGVGLSVEVSLAVPPGSLDYWGERLATHSVPVGKPAVRFGEKALPFRDPHGMELALVELTEDRPFSVWADGPVPAGQQVRGLHTARLWERQLGPTETFLTEVMGFESLGEEEGWRRYAVAGGGSGAVIDIRELPEERRGAWGVGGVHHIAWRVADVEEEMALRERIEAAGRRPTDLIDRFWFRSVYFMEPGGVLFELATDGPGFAIDEHPQELGGSLILPPWLEENRARIEQVLPKLTLPHQRG
jgi:glyoxalase family protein